MSIIPSPVTPAPVVVFPGGAVNEPEQATIYTVSATFPERIETVTMQADFAIRAAATYIFGLVLVDASGVTVYPQISGAVLSVDGAQLVAFLTWSRLGNDTAQVATFEHLFPSDNIRRAWVNVRLPDLVLQPASKIVLQCWVDDGGEGSDITVSNIATTVTRSDALLSSTTTQVGLPLLVDTSTG